MSTERPLSAGALYYPYIHIHDLNWLRANLVIFPCVKRMVPMNFSPRDDEGVAEFTHSSDEQEPLLQAADLWTDRCLQAQHALAEKLKESSRDEGFVTRYGKASARRLIDPTHRSFQIHALKLSEELKSVLQAESKLAWEPITPNSGFIEVHPRVGEAVMSTLAVASAQGDGLDIVGDERSGSLHNCLLEKDLNSIYDSWLNPSPRIEAPKAATGEELLEFILGIPGDLSTLSVERLRQIAAEREPINRLLTALRTQVAKIPAMDHSAAREEAFKQAASEAIQTWEADRRNWSGFARDFFSLEAASHATGFMKTVADKTFTGMFAGAATGTSVAGAGWMGSLAAGGIIGGGAGLVIGLISHAGITYYKAGQREKNSPYRFLTTLQDAGVVFRSEGG